MVLQNLSELAVHSGTLVSGRDDEGLLNNLDQFLVIADREDWVVGVFLENNLVGSNSVKLTLSSEVVL